PVYRRSRPTPQPYPMPESQSRKSVRRLAAVAVSQYLRVPRLDSIRNKILALAVLGTLVPAGISLGIAYRQNYRALREKISQELVATSKQTAGATSVWLRERIYDLRSFATSD